MFGRKMSYDFRLCLPRPGRSAAEIATADAEETGITEPVPANEERKRRVAQALIIRNPAFRPFAFGFEEIARFEKISLEEARKKYRHIELNGAEGGNGVQIMLFDDEAAVTFLTGIRTPRRAVSSRRSGAIWKSSARGRFLHLRPAN